MNRVPRTWGRLVVFGVMLCGAFGTAYAAGEQLPAFSAGTSTAHPIAGVDESKPHTHNLTPQPSATKVDGYELRLDTVTPDGHTLQYRVVGPDGTTVTDFIDNHGSQLHTVVIHRDLSGFQHIHPNLQADGSWRVTVPAGAWHLVFDMWPAGAATNIVLATNTDDEVAIAPVALPAADDAPVVDGLMVQRDGLTFTVTDRHGNAAAGLEPYLGSPGHLIAIRQGDLAYTHLHPSTTAVAAMPGMTMPAVDTPADVLAFTGSLTTGTYRVFLQFGHAGAVVTVPYTVVIP